MLFHNVSQNDHFGAKSSYDQNTTMVGSTGDGALPMVLVGHDGLMDAHHADIGVDDETGARVLMDQF